MGTTCTRLSDQKRKKTYIKSGNESLRVFATTEIPFATDLITTKGNKICFLKLKKVQVEYEQVKLLSSGLTHIYNQVAILNLSHNLLTLSSALLIADCLRNENNQIKHLFVNGNCFGFEGSKIICDALCHENSKVVCLDLSRNHIGNDGILKLIPIFKQNYILKRLYLCQNGIEQSGIHEIMNLVKLTQIKRVSLSLPFEFYPIKRELDAITKVSRSGYLLLLLALCSVKNIPRLGKRSPFKMFPIEIIRLIGEKLCHDLSKPIHCAGNCPSKHGLVEQKYVDNYELLCEVCRTNLKVGEIRYRCPICLYNECATCHAASTSEITHV